MTYFESITRSPEVLAFAMVSNTMKFMETYGFIEHLDGTERELLYKSLSEVYLELLNRELEPPDRHG